MACSILIVEDEYFVAIEIENALEDMGHRSAGIAADSRRALELAGDADVAFIDLNLNDGATGIGIGRQLAGRGVTVVFITANPSQLGDGIPGTLGVIAKPVDSRELRAAIRFAAARRRGRLHEPAQRRFRLFDRPRLDAEQLTG